LVHVRQASRRVGTRQARVPASRGQVGKCEVIFAWFLTKGEQSHPTNSCQVSRIRRHPGSRSACNAWIPRWPFKCTAQSGSVQQYGIRSSFIAWRNDIFGMHDSPSGSSAVSGLPQSSPQAAVTGAFEKNTPGQSSTGARGYGRRGITAGAPSPAACGWSDRGLPWTCPGTTKGQPRGSTSGGGF